MLLKTMWDRYTEAYLLLPPHTVAPFPSPDHVLNALILQLLTTLHPQTRTHDP